MSENKIVIGDKTYRPEDLTDKAKEMLGQIQFVDAQMRQLQNEWAISDTARLAYLAALKREMAQ